MRKRALWLSAAILVSLVWTTGCREKKTDAGPSMSCYLASQFTCNDYPKPTASQLTDVPVVCSSGSGELKQPAACPTAGFKGKCTRADGPTVPGPYLERFYQGADIAYAQDFCVNTVHGVWATTF